MTPEQEIRAKAIEICMNYVATLTCGALVANRSMSANAFDDVDVMVGYITSGKKP